MDMIPRDKAIAALREINKLRHTWLDGTMKAMEENVFDGECLLLRECCDELTEAIERAYEILNEKD